MKLFVSIIFLAVAGTSVAQGSSGSAASQNVRNMRDRLEGVPRVPDQVIQAETLCAMQLVQVNGAGSGVVVNQNAVNGTMVCGSGRSLTIRR